MAINNLICHTGIQARASAESPKMWTSPRSVLRGRRPADPCRVAAFKAVNCPGPSAHQSSPSTSRTPAGTCHRTRRPPGDVRNRSSRREQRPGARVWPSGEKLVDDNGLLVRGQNRYCRLRTAHAPTSAAPLTASSPWKTHSRRSSVRSTTKPTATSSACALSGLDLPGQLCSG